MSIEGRFDGTDLRLFVNGHRLSLLWTLNALGWAAVIVDYRTDWFKRAKARGRG